MKKAGWKKRIKESCLSAGTYKPFFDDVINTLADILEKRDDAAEQYKKYGSKPVITYTNKGGNTNPTKNPMLSLWNELNKTALTYWKEMGLTPSEYKKITGDKPETEKQSGLMAALSSLEI